MAAEQLTAFQGGELRLGVGLRRPPPRTHRRKADVRGSMPGSCRLPTSRFDPYRPFGLLQSCPMLSADFSSFASTKRPLVTSQTRPGPDHRPRPLTDSRPRSLHCCLARPCDTHQLLRRALKPLPTPWSSKRIGVATQQETRRAARAALDPWAALRNAGTRRHLLWPGPSPLHCASVVPAAR